VIGQPDFRHQWYNYPTNNPSTPNQAGLFAPTGLVVDASGNLYVADTGNSRVLRFPAPFANYKPGTPNPPTWFSASPASSSPSPTHGPHHGRSVRSGPDELPWAPRFRREAQPRALLSGAHLYQRTVGHPCIWPARFLFGRRGRRTEPAQFAAPHSNDSDDRLYVADTGNGEL